MDCKGGPQTTMSVERNDMGGMRDMTEGTVNNMGTVRSNSGQLSWIFQNFVVMTLYHGFIRPISFFQYHNTPPQYRALMASFHMVGKAIPWFQDLKELGAIISCEAFVRALHVCFGETTYDDLMETLTRLRQVSMVEVYKTQFEAISNR